MRSHVNSLCSRAHFYLRNISKIRHLLDRRTTATHVRAYVTSRLGNVNALLCGLPQTLLSKVQRVQNAAVSDWPTGAHNSSTERTTLSACPSADFVLVLTYQALRGTAPQYMIAAHCPKKSPPQFWGQSISACDP